MAGGSVLSAVMIPTTRSWAVIAAVTGAAIGWLLTPAAAQADPHNPHNVTYIVKVDAPISSARAIYMVTTPTPLRPR